MFEVFEDENRKINRWEKELGQKITQKFKQVGGTFIESVTNKITKTSKK
jgi:hypothetical protein